VTSARSASLDQTAVGGRSRATRSPVGWLRDGLAAWLPALPLLLLAGALLVAPTVQLIVQSLRGSTGHWTLQFWREALASNGVKRSIRTSVDLGVICATVALVVGGPLAWFISRMVTLRRSLWLALLNVAANFGGIGLAFGYIAALGTFGMVTLAMKNVGLPFQAPEMGTSTSLVLAYSYTNVPLFVLLTLPAMAILRTEWLEAAEVSAATRWQFWRYVGLPILTPFLAAGWLLIFTWSIGIYGLAYAMGFTAAQTGRLRLITLQIGITLNTGAGREERAAVLAVVLLLLAAVSLLAYRLILRWALRWFV
jgi:putative spermidine/putrescine transport system permease protein